MELKTKFALGAKAWTLRDFKAAEIEVRALTIDESGVWLLTTDDYRRYHEDNCFPTKEALMEYIAAE